VGGPTEIFLGAIDRGDAHLGSGRVRLLQAGEMAGSSISLPGSVLRSAGLEVLGLGTGTMPPPEVITRMLAELLDLLSSGKLRIDIERVPLSAAGEVWTRDQQGRRPVFIP
jgi:NADPH2:quinone reductase